MRAISEMVLDILMNAPGLMALVSDNVYPILAPQTVQEPYVTYNIRMQGRATKDVAKNADISIRCFGSSFGQLLSVAEQVQLALDETDVSFHFISQESAADADNYVIELEYKLIKK